ALTSLWQVISRANKFIDETMSYKVVKDHSKQEELAGVLAHLAENLRRVDVLLQPFMPETPKKMFDQLNIQDENLKSWDSLANFGQIPQGTKVQKGSPIFPRLEIEKEVEYIKGKMGGSIKEPEKKEVTEDQTPEITINDFAKIDLRIAKVIHAEPVKKANKLLKLQLDLGYEKRQVVSGIAEHYKPEELIGRKVIVVANLKPAKLRGEISEGMILAGEKDGVLSLATVGDDLPIGAKVK